MILDTLPLADGSNVDVRTGKVVRSLPKDMIRIPGALEAVETVSRVKMRLSDMPAPPKQMNVISVVVFYSMLGLSDHEIGMALSITAEQVSRIKKSDVFIEMRRTITDRILSDDADNIRTMFQQHARDAAGEVLSIMKCGDKEDKVRLDAAKDILDRSGYRPVDVQEHRITVEGGLRIEYIERKPIDTGGVVIEGDAE